MANGGSVIVFPIRFRMAAGLGVGRRNALLDAFIAEAIEGNDLQFGGGGSGEWWSGVAEPFSKNEATDDQRREVAEWLGSHPLVMEFVVGRLGDGDEDLVDRD